ncbi:MAG: hypothetical protein GY795_43270 [Desulfobacterales bacterium]|nr:hypothetical protein [Desulfobacterales bacterium]
METFSWLHLADLNLKESYDANFMSLSIIEDIKKVKLKPNLIFITGDLTYSGKKEQFDIFNKFLHTLSEATEVKLDKIFTVPGNHDINRQHVSLSARTLKNQLVSNSNTGIISEILNSPFDRETFFAPLTNYNNNIPLVSKISPEKPFFLV